MWAGWWPQPRMPDRATTTRRISSTFPSSASALINFVPTSRASTGESAAVSSRSAKGRKTRRGGWFGADLVTAPGARDQLPANMGHILARLIWSRTGVRARAEKPGLLGRSCQALASEVDHEESWRCGQAAVRAAIAGESGKMVSIRRVPGERYRSEMILVPLESVARIERTFPGRVDERRSQ